MLALACATVGACASAPPVGDKDLLAFLVPGVTTRAEVLQRLGPTPDVQYEAGRIVAYRIGEDAGGYLKGGKPAAPYSLVLVFGGDDVLSRQALVRVRAK